MVTKHQGAKVEEEEEAEEVVVEAEVEARVEAGAEEAMEEVKVEAGAREVAVEDGGKEEMVEGGEVEGAEEVGGAVEAGVVTEVARAEASKEVVVGVVEQVKPPLTRGPRRVRSGMRMAAQRITVTKSTAVSVRGLTLIG